jgi:hypothetical protein
MRFPAIAARTAGILDFGSVLIRDIPFDPHEFPFPMKVVPAFFEKTPLLARHYSQLRTVCTGCFYFGGAGRVLFGFDARFSGHG